MNLQYFIGILRPGSDDISFQRFQRFQAENNKMRVSKQISRGVRGAAVLIFRAPGIPVAQNEKVLVWENGTSENRMFLIGTARSMRYMRAYKIRGPLEKGGLGTVMRGVSSVARRCKRHDGPDGFHMFDSRRKFLQNTNNVLSSSVRWRRAYFKIKILHGIAALRKTGGRDVS
jgi:hypothetical protein